VPRKKGGVLAAHGALSAGARARKVVRRAPPEGNNTL
jgi:hypothetical protein